MKFKFAILACVMAWFCRDGARAQSVCVTQFNQVTTTGVSSTIDNRFTMCSSWVVTYNLTGFSAISLRLETANDNNGAPGTFALSTGTVLQGVNPSTATNCQTSNACQFIINPGYAPWVRLNLTSKTGTGSLTALAFGFQSAVPVTATISGGLTLCTAGTPCIVIGPDAPGVAPTQNPVQNSGFDGTNVRRILTDTSGRQVEVGGAAEGAAPAGNPVEGAMKDAAANIFVPTACTLSTTFDISASGRTSLVALSGSTQIFVCHFAFIDVAGGNTIQLQYGTGATCGTGTANLGMLYKNTAAAAQDYLSFGPLIVPAGNRLCINLGAATEVTGELTYGQHN